MGLVQANRNLLITVIVTLLVAACASPTPTPIATPTSAVTPTPTPTATPTATPTVIPTSTVTPAPIVTPTPTDTPLLTKARWQEVPAQSSVSRTQLSDVSWTGTRFVAVGGAPGSPGAFLDSPDGVVWHRQAGFKKGVAPTILAAGPGGVVALGWPREHQEIWFSPDGLTWVMRPDAFPKPSVGTDTVTVTDVVATGEGWLAVGRQDPSEPCASECAPPIRAHVWTSNDGTHWTRISNQPSLKGGGMDAVARGNDGFVAVGVDSFHAAIWTSPDGLAWSRIPDAPMFHGPTATGVAVRDGIMVVVGSVYHQDVCPPGVAARFCPGARAWWSADGKTWSKASVENAKDGQVFSVAATPDGFLAAGWSPGCLGGIWGSTDGRAWRCEASARRFKGFGPDAAAASDTVEIAVGSTDAGAGPPVGAVWLRATR